MNIHCEAPENFEFSCPEKWPTWRKRFDRYRDATDLGRCKQSRQVNVLIYSMGERAEDILETSSLSADDKLNYDKVVAFFDQYFIGTRNVIYERTKFNTRFQGDESVDEFLCDLHTLASHCDYGVLKEELIRDRFVVGLRDQKVADALKMEATLTLEVAVRKAKAKENLERNKSLFEEKERKILKVKNERKKPEKVDPTKREECECCNRKHFEGRRCPALYMTCFTCGEKGHFAKSKKCPKKAVNVLNEEEDDNRDEEEEDFTFIQAVGGKSSQPWRVKIKMGSEQIWFKADTGADVTVLPFSQLPKGTTLKPSKSRLFAANSQALDVVGVFSARLQHKGKEIEEEVHVVQGANEPLLSRNASVALNIIRFLEKVDAKDEKQNKFVKLYPKLFSGLGLMKGEYDIQMEPDAPPVCINVPRRVPIPLIPKVTEELLRMENMGVIRRVTEPTPWCSGLVVVPKPDGRVRLCVDLTNLNKFVKRENLILPDVEGVLGMIGKNKYFSKLDANCGFWQTALSKESQLLTTFITPIGRFCFQRLPFGISSAPELFQRKMSEILEGIPGVLCFIDDVLCMGETEEEMEQRLKLVLERLEEEGVTLNKDKCEFNKKSIKFLGHLIDSEGIKPDPEKIRAILEMKSPNEFEPKDRKSAIRRLEGMLNHIGRFIPHLSEKLKPIRELKKENSAWVWDTPQEEAFQNLKQELKNITELAPYNMSDELIVSTDASSYGLGGVLLTKNKEGQLKPVAFVSKTLNETEMRYAQIEKEAYAICWACERFEKFLLGRRFHIQTDHKPLVPLFSTKSLESMPPRILRFRLRMTRFSYSIEHVPGKDLATADTLSRAPLAFKENDYLSEEADMFINSAIRYLPVTDERLERLKEEITKDEDCSLLLSYCKDGWPEWKDVPHNMKIYWKEKGLITEKDGLLLKDNRLIIPREQRRKVMEQIHTGHLGINKCLDRARESVWWPGITDSIKQLVQNCNTCLEKRQVRAEPMIPTMLPNSPWEIVGADICEYNKVHYLVVVDYYSRFVNVVKLSRMTSSVLVAAFKNMFATHGIFKTLRCDNGTQLVSREMKEFSQNYGFCICTSSPRYPQSNGEAERAVQTVKNILKKEKDFELGLLSYNASPGVTGLSPAELLMGRRLRTTVPMHSSQLKPLAQFHEEHRRKDEVNKKKQKFYYDRRHGVKERMDFSEGDKVWIVDLKKNGTVKEKTDSPRSYVIETDDGVHYRRTSRHLLLKEGRCGVKSLYHCTTVPMPVRKVRKRGNKGASTTLT